MSNEVKLDNIDNIISKDEKNYKKAREELSTTMSEQEIKDLEELVENACKEVEKMPISNEKIYEVALDNKNEMIDIKAKILNFTQKQKETNLSLNSFFRKTWKLMFLIFILSSVIGYSLAVFQHDNIKPFFKDIAKELIKKVIHTE